LFLLKGDQETVSIFQNGTMFEFAVRSEIASGFDRLVTMPSSSTVRQLKQYI